MAKTGMGFNLFWSVYIDRKLGEFSTESSYLLALN